MDVMKFYIKTVVVEMNNAFDYDHARKIFNITGKYDASRLCPQKITTTAENANSMHKIKEKVDRYFSSPFLSSNENP